MLSSNWNKICKKEAFHELFLEENLNNALNNHSKLHKLQASITLWRRIWTPSVQVDIFLLQFRVWEFRIFYSRVQGFSASLRLSFSSLAIVEARVALSLSQWGCFWWTFSSISVPHSYLLRFSIRKIAFFFRNGVAKAHNYSWIPQLWPSWRPIYHLSHAVADYRVRNGAYTLELDLITVNCICLNLYKFMLQLTFRAFWRS